MHGSIVIHGPVLLSWGACHDVHLVMAWARMHVGRIAPLSADISYPVDKCKKMVCMSPG